MAPGVTTRDEISCAKLGYVIYRNTVSYSISEELPQGQSLPSLGVGPTLLEPLAFRCTRLVSFPNSEALGARTSYLACSH